MGGGVITRGTGITIPAKFTPSSGLPNLAPYFVFCMSPSVVFGVQIPRERFICYDDHRTALVFTDGACLNNGQPNDRAGWAFYFGPGPDARTVSRRLERNRPFGDVAEQTSNRAELRAAIAAIRGVHWLEDGYRRLVIASDSEYLVEGITTWIKRWIKNGWKTSEGETVKNRDLWEMLLGEVESIAECNHKIEFWRIPREYNTVADSATKKACEQADVEDFVDGIMADCI